MIEPARLLFRGPSRRLAGRPAVPLAPRAYCDRCFRRGTGLKVHQPTSTKPLAAIHVTGVTV